MFSARRATCSATYSVARHSTFKRAESSLASHSARNAYADRRQPPPPDAAAGHKRAFIIRSWNKIGSMGEGLAIVRAFELKYGRIRDYKLLRDSEMVDRYQVEIVANFQDDANYENLFASLDKESPSVRLDIPSIKESGLGQPSLVDMQGLFDAHDKDEQFVSRPWENLPGADEGGAPPMKEVTLTITRKHPPLYGQHPLAFLPLLSDPEPRPPVNIQTGIAKSFVGWGGFYSPKAPSPPAVDHVIGETDGSKSAPPLSKPPPPPETRMQATIKHMRNRYDLFEEPPLPTRTTEQSSEVEVSKETDTVEVASERLVFSLPEQPSEVEEIPSEDVTEAPDGADAEVAQPVQPTHSAKRRNILLMAQAQAAQRFREAGAPGTAKARSNEAHKAAALARKPLPEEVIPSAPEEVEAEQKRKEDEEKAIKATVFQRLQKLWGGF